MFTTLFTLFLLKKCYIAMKCNRKKSNEFAKMVDALYQVKENGHQNLVLGDINEVYAEYIKEFLMIYALDIIRNVQMTDVNQYLQCKLNSLDEARHFIDEFKSRFPKTAVRRSPRFA